MLVRSDVGTINMFKAETIRLFLSKEAFLMHLIHAVEGLGDNRCFAWITRYFLSSLESGREVNLIRESINERSAK